jgi:methyl-accepting chemotaxis protein
MNLTWGMVERIEQMTDQIDNINRQIEQSTKIYNAINEWILQASEILVQMNKDIKKK